jgi:hypothetical protein
MRKSRLLSGTTDAFFSNSSRLEHPCWSHFHFDDCNPMPELAEDAKEGGHALLASAQALRRAPEHVFTQLAAAKKALEAKGVQKATPWYKRLSRPTSLSASTASSQASSSTPSVDVPSDISWKASGLTIASLHALASSLTAPDLEITPVQAFFELAMRFPLELLLMQEMCRKLRKEFVGVVRCEGYGSAIERGAFESVVERVLGQASAPAR